MAASMLSRHIFGPDMNKLFDMELFLTGGLAGSKATRQRHICQAKVIQATTLERWQHDNPWTWQRKHLVWFLKHGISHRAEATRYYYELTVKLIALGLGKSWFLP